jgi:hypothetical protein
MGRRPTKGMNFPTSVAAAKLVPLENKGTGAQSGGFRAPRSVKEYNEKVEYIQLNPVRAGLVSFPEDWRWSSYNEHAGMRADGRLHMVTRESGSGYFPARRG